MIISKVDSILSKHPIFANMEEGRKIGIYNKIYTRIFYERSDITIINRKSYSSDKSYLLFYQHIHNINLSAHKDVDSLMNEHSLLKNLTDAQKIAIFEIAAYRINMYRTLREDQEYFFSTHKSAQIKNDTIFEPILTAIAKVLSPLVKSYIYEPLATVNAVILSLLFSTKYYEPLLSVSSKIWGFVSETITYIPLLEVQYSIGQDKNISIAYLPLATVSYLILASKHINVVYSPLLQASYNVIMDADYIKSYTYQPPLLVSYQVLTG